MENITVIPQTHGSPETARVVDDYPYSFTLRCSIRYWIEFKPGKGFRFVSQTSNPKVARADGALVWNKPKASVYSLLAYIVIDEKGHVDYRVINEYHPEELAPFLAAHRDKLNAAQIDVATKYARTHELYNQYKAQGDPFQIAGKRAVAQYQFEIGALNQAQRDTLFRVLDNARASTSGSSEGK